jgi:DHA1 family tetracycline resistance protein-like MFS transporter
MTSQNFRGKQDHIEYLERFKINQKRAMFTIILSILLDVFGYTMVLPLLPIIAKDFGASDFMIGIFISSNAFAALLFIPIWGWLSDKYGRKPILVISQAGTCVSFLILGFSNTISIILFARILDGMFGGQIPVIRAYITDITTPQTRASHMGKIMVGYTLGMTLGPLVGGFLGAIHWRFPPYFASSLSVVSIIMTIKIIVESMPEERRAEIKLIKIQANPDEKSSVWTKEVINRFIQIFLLSLISFIFTSSFTLVLYKRYDADPSTTGLVMAVAGLAVMIYGGILMKPMIRKIGEKRLLIITFILFIITFLFYPYLFELWMVFLFILPYSFCVAFMRPLITSNMTKAVGLDKQGELSGWSTNLQAFSQTIAPLISTGFLQLGGLTIGLIFLDSYHLIGLTNVILALILLFIGYRDIKSHPKLYYYEKIRKKRKALKKKKSRDKE